MLKIIEVIGEKIIKTVTVLVVFLSPMLYGQEVLNNYESQYNQTSSATVARYEIAGKYVQALFFNDQQEKAYAVLKQNIASAEKEADGKYAAYLFAVAAMNSRLVDNDALAQQYLESAIYHSNRTTDFATKGYVKYCEGWLEARNQQDTKAVEHFIEALKYLDQAEETPIVYSHLSSVYGELTGIYSKWDVYDLQFKYSKLSLAVALKQDDPNHIFDAYMSMGYMYEQLAVQNSHDENATKQAESYYLKAINVFYANQDKMLTPSDLSFVAINLANLYLNYFPESYRLKVKEYAELAQRVSIETGQSIHLASASGLLSELAILEGDIAAAKNYLLIGLKEITENSLTDLQIRLTIYESLSDLATKDLNYAEALRYYKEFIATYKLIYDKEQALISKRLESQFDKERQQQELIRLQLVTEKKEQQIALMNSLGIQQKQELENVKLSEAFQRKQLELSRLESDKHAHELTISQQNLRLSKLENKTRKDELVNYVAELNFKNKLNQYYIASIGLFIVLLSLLLYALKQRNKRLKQREELYSLEIEQERKSAKISTLTALLEGQEQERERLARDLHDGLGGILSSTKLQLTHLGNRIDDSSKAEMFYLVNQIDGAVDELRRVAHNLMPDLLHKYGLEEALKEYAIRMSNEILDIDVQFLSYTDSLDKERQLLVYRIIQELVNNAIKHADAKQIIIQLAESQSGYIVTVEDDGKGFDMDNTALNQSAGLHNIQSRVQFLKGTIVFQSEINVGTSIEIQFNK